MKTNQITAIGVSVIAVGVIIGGAIYFNKETSRKKNQEIINTYYSCMTGVTTRGELYELTRRLDGKFAAREVLYECLKDYGIDTPNESLIRQFEY